MEILGQRGNFSRKQISLRFDIINPDGSTDELLLKDAYRITANIQQGGGGAGSVASIQVEGLNHSDIQRLSHVSGYPSVENPMVSDQSNSIVTVEAGAYGSVLSHVYSGFIQSAFAQYEPNGDVIFNISAGAAGGLLQDVNYFSMSGTIPITTILKRFQEISLIPIVDHGGWSKNQSLTNPVFKGTPEDMIKDVCSHTGAIYHYLQTGGEVAIDTGASSDSVLHVWGPLYNERDSQNEIPLISKETGLIGYPNYNSNGIEIETIFNPQLSFYGTVRVESNYIPAGWITEANGSNANGQSFGTNSWNGLWLITNLYHSISSETVGGAWKTFIECQRSDIAEVSAVES